MRKCFIISIILFSLALTATAQAGQGKASLCTKDGWTVTQSGTGAAFSSKHECVRASEVFSPTLQITPSAVGAEEWFTITGTGFHEGALATLSYAVTGQGSFYTDNVGTYGDGSVWLASYFPGCGVAFPYDLTVTVTDSFGVHASARMTLC